MDHYHDGPPKPSRRQHSAVVLFYKYFPPSSFPLLHKFPRFYEEKLLLFQKELCHSLHLKGRVLLAAEGVNGTLSACSPEILQQYINSMKKFELVEVCGVPEGDALPEFYSNEYLFDGIDWKESLAKSDDVLEPFPDLKISIVAEIISSGGSVSVEDVVKYGGKHLSPKEFHQTLAENENVVLVDVRNTFEHDIGHFVHPTSLQAAMNPEMVTFSHFDSNFCAKHADDLHDKKVLMYCTGGIRCEKASAMLRLRGVRDVSQLQGGIHRYLEEFGDQGFFKGRNFVFDQRVAMKPSECKPLLEMNNSIRDTIVGKCVECEIPFDELSGSRVCTVCRDLVLICECCQSKLPEYHCRRHSGWKSAYFTFLERFDWAELERHREQLSELRETYLTPVPNKNVRRTLARQMEKVTARMQDLGAGRAEVDRQAPSRCRTCMDLSTLCDGQCWGFWKTQQTRKRSFPDNAVSELLHISIGFVVEPGPHWNILRLGSPTNFDGNPRRGIVVEVKSWGAGGEEQDCVAVKWSSDNDAAKPDHLGSLVSSAERTQIYRWGVVALDGQRMYDLKRVN
jgi:predicted sulfurtransferase